MSTPLATDVPARRDLRAVLHEQRRRLVAGAVALPVLLWLYGAAAGRWTGTATHSTLVVLVALVASATVATYLPIGGAWYRPVVGCSQCAMVAGITVPAAGVVLGSAPGDVATTVLALLAASIGLVQRLRDPRSCPRR